MTDPVSWLQIEKGWNVVSADGVLVGKIVEVTGDEAAACSRLISVCVASASALPGG